MIPARKGVIVNISTSSVLATLPVGVPYVASQPGVVGRAPDTAREPGALDFRRNVIMPGLINNARSQTLAHRAANLPRHSFTEVEREFPNRGFERGSEK